MTVGAPPSADLPSAWVAEEDFATYGIDTTPVAVALPEAIVAASRWLWRRTGRRWHGTMPVTVRPVLCDDRTHHITTWAWRLDEGWWGRGPGSAYTGPVPVAPTSVELPPPVRSVDSVVIDGETLAESAYLLVANRRLVRIDGQSWPTRQDIDRDPSAAKADPADPEAWAVTYEWGYPPPPDGRRAAAVLAYELALLLTPGAADACRIGTAAQSVSRNGETLTFDLSMGKTGLWEVDLFTDSVNPRRLAHASPAVIRYDLPLDPRPGDWRSQGPVGP